MMLILTAASIALKLVPLPGTIVICWEVSA
jgi:hypothetical protein